MGDVCFSKIILFFIHLKLEIASAIPAVMPWNFLQSLARINSASSVFFAISLNVIIIGVIKYFENPENASIQNIYYNPSKNKTFV